MPSPAPTTFFVDVPRGAPALHVALSFSGDSQQEIDGALVAPSGDALDRQTTLPLGSTDVTHAGAELDLAAVAPQPGRWEIVFGLYGPAQGRHPHLPYRGRISLAPAPISATGLPESSATTLAPGAHTAVVHIVNRSAVPHAYVLDARSDGWTVARLSGPDSVTITPGSSPSVPVAVPTRTRALIETMASSAPLSAVFGVRDITPYGFTDDPELYAASTSGSAVLARLAPQIVDGLWLQQPTVLGPFGPSGATVSPNVSLRTYAVLRPFDTAVTSATSDPWLATVEGSSAITPVVVPAGSSADVAVTTTVSQAPGRLVRGTLYVDDWDPRLHISGEVAGLRYAYRTG